METRNEAGEGDESDRSELKRDNGCARGSLPLLKSMISM